MHFLVKAHIQCIRLKVGQSTGESNGTVLFSPTSFPRFIHCSLFYRKSNTVSTTIRWKVVIKRPYESSWKQLGMTERQSVVERVRRYMKYISFSRSTLCTIPLYLNDGKGYPDAKAIHSATILIMKQLQKRLTKGNGKGNRDEMEENPPAGRILQ